MLLRTLIEHYGKYKTTQEGAALVMTADLDYFEWNILRYELHEEEDPET